MKIAYAVVVVLYAVLIGLPLTLIAADTADLERVPAKRQPTMWRVRIEGEKRELLIPIELAKDYHLRPGQTISDETARLLAIELGAKYDNEQLEFFERHKD